MANLFDASQSPMVAPTNIVVGDYLLWRRSLPDYSNATYTATYVAKIAGNSASEILIVGTANDSDYLFTVTSTTSSAFLAGNYFWQLEISSGANRLVIERGNWIISPDLDIGSADPRSHADIMITKIESLLSGRGDADVSSYSINGRSINKLSIAELVEWRDYYKAEQVKERREARRLSGQSTGSMIKVRF